MKAFRKLICAALALALPLALAACATTAGSSIAASPYTPLEIVQVVAAGQPEPVVLVATSFGDEDFAFRLSSAYMIDAATVVDGASCYSPGFEANEIAVLLMADEAAAQAAEGALLAYTASREKAFAGYAPEQAALAGRGQVVLHGRYVALLIGGDGLREAFLACFTDAPPPLPASSPFAAATPDSVPGGTGSSSESPSSASSVAAPPPQDDAYDAQAVVQAWQTGDASGLSARNREILEACRRAIDEVIREDMDDYTKELAIHDWIIGWADYDWATVSQSPNAKPEPDNDNPYGLLVRQKGICSGYATSFQLFMDLLGIECIIVEGTANEDRGDHAWNQVKLDGEWYCVDVTWNDPFGEGTFTRAQQHRFFNVTSEYMRSTLHYWDESATPEATGTTYQWRA